MASTHPEASSSSCAAASGLDHMDDVTQQSASKRAKKAKAPECPARRYVNHWFSDLSDFEKYMKKVDKLTLLERVKKEKMAGNGSTTPRLSKDKAKALRKMYHEPKASCLVLTEEEEAQAISDKLSTVLAIFRHPSTSRRSREPLLRHFRTCPLLVTKRDFVEVAREVYPIKPLTATNALFVIAFGKWCVRCGLQNKFPTQVNDFRSSMNAAIAFQFATMKKKNMKFGEFWAKYGDACSLVMNVNMMAKVFQHAPRWHEVAHDVASE